jgi:hypothetical protein
MAFSVISFAPGITDAERARAQAGAPPCTATDASYFDLLGRSGWAIVESLDVTRAFADITRRELAAFEARASDLRELIGDADFAERVALRRARVAGLEEGLIRRGLFFVQACVA